MPPAGPRKLEGDTGGAHGPALCQARRSGRPASLIAALSGGGAMAAGQTACRMCGRSFEPYGRARRSYCKQCSDRADRAIAQTPVVRCKECGKEFAAPSRRHHYCSTACRDELARRRNRENRRKYMADPERRALALARSRLHGAADRARKRGGGRMHAGSGEARGAGRPTRTAAESDQITCGLCGRTFAPYGHGSSPVHCKRCRARADREIARVLRVDCKACGGKFSTKNRLARYCSPECRAAGRTVRDREYMRTYVKDPEKRIVRLARRRALYAASRRSDGEGGAPRRRA